MTWREMFAHPGPLARFVVSIALSVTVAALAVVLAFGFFSQQQLVREATTSRDQTAARATARITDLTHRNDTLQAEIDTDIATIATLRQQAIKTGAKP